jgi:hypothetical protein
LAHYPFHAQGNASRDSNGVSLTIRGSVCSAAAMVLLALTTKEAPLTGSKMTDTIKRVPTVLFMCPPGAAKSVSDAGSYFHEPFSRAAITASL